MHKPEDARYNERQQYGTDRNRTHKGKQHPRFVFYQQSWSCTELRSMKYSLELVTTT